MKKIITLIIIFIMMISLTACGSGDEKNNENLSTESKDEKISDLGFKNIDDIQNFLDDFNNNTDGYAYMVESDAQTLEGNSFKEQGYSVYRILIWGDKEVEKKKDSLGDFKGTNSNNNLNIRLIYNPEGDLVLLKTTFSVSNSSSYVKTNNAISCEAMKKVLSALFPKNTEEQNNEIYKKLFLPTIENIDSYEPKDDYDSRVDLVEDFFAHCGYDIDTSSGDSVGVLLTYNFGNMEYRLICNPFGNFQRDIFVINWDIFFALPDEYQVYEAALTMSS